jgi:hypothetical protein
MARHRKPAKKFPWGLVSLIILAALLLISAVAFMINHFATAEDPADPVTMCPASGPAGHTIVLVDNTEPFNFIQRQALTQRFKDLADDQVPEGHLVSVFVLGESFADNAMPIFEKCNPGTGENKSKLTANPARIKKRFDDQFRKPLMALRKEITLETPSAQSPVFEMLQLVSINGFGRVDTTGPRTLIVFSDMLPHMPGYSMFKELPEPKAFFDSAYGRKSQARLDDVEVHLNYLLNYPKLQTTKQAAFWEQYFDKSGAELVGVDVFEG